MNTFFLLLFSSLLLIFTPEPQIQKDCEVLLETIALEYEGECKKGLAHGTGKAIGSHSYEGSFKKGFPDGVGIYTWSNGNMYKGDFKSGLKDGKGELYIRRLGEADSIVNGYWDNDKYIGAYKTAYSVGQKRNILRTRFVHMSDTPNQVEFIIQRNGLPIGVTQLQASADKSPMFENTQSIVAFTRVVYPLTNASINFYSTSVFNSFQLDCALNFEIYREGHWRVFIQI